MSRSLLFACRMNSAMSMVSSTSKVMQAHLIMLRHLIMQSVDMEDKHLVMGLEEQPKIVIKKNLYPAVCKH